ncbi:family 2 glycosyl transferase [Leptolyngbya boryana NIES-2135]|jgi:glycosyltransferase involved in cell wall biosynthesis|uniref:Family 2 glycosyl transferase n=1 Tax=Leptolyngbya boryana NIES-2135 TaxID=1973484 RepID=A0A1Z4JBC4_LEPBY|nr:MULTISPECIES: glycosyltransferase family 2 protein [Leptolyngbya]BAY54085.1 family 2 glycosyl transferase [Leptolyngbya boryana NIES-2135]MBD2369742.1 glycosyltransferase [Leptolyngbya sp. FACHB-161]MBD2376057.1 glycosyltransferase [Leptolyngbya sp. FACHB-238]MBD2400333.1 glycosyltransferase [Leptolyngbya sp. FACHB-239]MBD2406874.1 glycosyltransferase [Leptolyngbya sp. FACHB-402]
MLNVPKISIVTPSFNQAPFLEATLQSVLSQNYPNLEYIVIDGGSTDGSVEIIKRYESQLHYWCSEPDAGQYAAINKGFSHATGEIMAWLNSDDMQCPWALKTVASIMSELSEVEWLTTLNPGLWDWYGFCLGFRAVPGYDRSAFLEGRYLPHSPKTLRGIGSIQQESTFWRRSLWEKIGGQISTEYKLAGDFDLWAQFYQHADLYGVASPLAGFRSQNTQKSSHLDLYVAESLRSLKSMRSPNVFRQLQLHRVPIVRSWLKSHLSYSCQRIVRTQSNSAEGRWTIESYQPIF